MMPMAIGGDDAGFTASTSGSLPPGSDDIAEGPGDHRPSDNRSSENHDGEAPEAAVVGRGRRPVRRMRGRPLGSKNKPKPPVVITLENPAALRFQIVHVANGANVEATVASFAISRRVGILIIGCAGAVANVMLREPFKPVAAPPTVFSLPGRYDILSLQGYFLPEPLLSRAVEGLVVYLAGEKGQILGGNVVGQLVASGPVMVLAATFSPSMEDREAAARSTMLRAFPQGSVQMLMSSGAGAGGGGGSWASMSDPAAAATAVMPVLKLRQNLVFNSNQIPDPL